MKSFEFLSPSIQVLYDNLYTALEKRTSILPFITQAKTQMASIDRIPRKQWQITNLLDYTFLREVTWLQQSNKLTINTLTITHRTLLGYVLLLIPPDNQERKTRRYQSYLDLYQSLSCTPGFSPKTRSEGMGEIDKDAILKNAEKLIDTAEAIMKKNKKMYTTLQEAYDRLIQRVNLIDNCFTIMGNAMHSSMYSPSWHQRVYHLEAMHHQLSMSLSSLRELLVGDMQKIAKHF